MIHSSLRAPPGGSSALAPPQHASLEVGHRALLLGPLQHRQHQVGQPRRLGEEEVAHHEQIEAGERVAHGLHVGGRDDDVGSVHQQRTHAARHARRLQELNGRDAGTGDHVGDHPPHRGDMGAGSGIRDLAIARKLVALLPVLATALAVALTGQRAVAVAGSARQAEQQREVDRSRRRVGAVGVLLDAASGQDVRPSGRRRAGARAARIVAAGTPVTDCVRSGHHGDTERRSAARPTVRSSR